MIGRIEISQTWAAIGIRQRAGDLRVRQPSADLTVQQGRSELILRRLHDAKIAVDYTATRNDLQLQAPLALSRECVAQAAAKAAQGIARIAQEGDLMMNQPNAIPELAARTWPEPEFNVGLVPGSPPAVTAVGQPWPDVEARIVEPQVDAAMRPPDIAASRAAVQVYLRQRHSLRVDYIPAQETWA